ncbi:unnamed protein product [Trichobilharzia regenti]|nr:unnamed protein product [Trichobilharzia regenti]
MRESSISTAPINIRSALPRGYYPSSTSSLPRNTKSSYHDQNTRTRRSSINPVDVPQLFDSMNEIQHLRSQLNTLSKLIESDGSNVNRTPSAVRTTASKSTAHSTTELDIYKLRRRSTSRFITTSLIAA